MERGGVYSVFGYCKQILMLGWKLRVANYMSWGGLETRKTCMVFSHENCSKALMHGLIDYKGCGISLFKIQITVLFHFNPVFKWNHLLF